MPATSTSRRTRIVAVATTVLAASAAAASTAPASQGARTDARVVRVVDGDQVVLATRAGAASYRLLGVQAPSLGDCFGRQARTRLRTLLPRGSRVRVITRRRGLRSVVLLRRAKGVNRLVVSSGHAKASLRDRSRLARTLVAAQDRAQAAERGLWGACVAAEDRDARTPVVEVPARDGQREEQAPRRPSPPRQDGPRSPEAPARPGTRRSPVQFQEFVENSVFTRVSASSDFGGSSNRSDFTFCPGARYGFRSESINNGFVSTTEEAGRWRVASLTRDDQQRADAAVLQLVTEQSDVESFDPASPESERTFTVLIEAFDDGRVHLGGQPVEHSPATVC